MLLQREVLEAKAVGGASTVKVEAVVCTTLTEHSEPYNRKAIHASRLKTQARMCIEDGCLSFSNVRATLPANAAHHERAD
jgi:hypothetical protein